MISWVTEINKFTQILLSLDVKFVDDPLLRKEKTMNKILKIVKRWSPNFPLILSKFKQINYFPFPT